MAGGIVISEGKVVGLNTLGFLHLIEAIRDGFGADDASVMRNVFSPADEGAMTFITAMDLAAADYQVFAKAVEKACQTSVGEGDLLVGESIWSMLLDAVRSDARYQTTGEGDEHH